MNRIIAFILCIIFFPIFCLLALLIKVTSKGPVLFRQKRVGKDKKTFTIYKFRTMVHNAEQLKNKYIHLNQADNPAFKIYNDPRFTVVGKILSRTGMDELPQLLNIVKGEMAFVGPRPLPVKEVKKLPLKYDKRFSVLPGITSLWVIRGGHTLTLKQWMESDIWYSEHKSINLDFIIGLKTIWLLIHKFAFL